MTGPSIEVQNLTVGFETGQGHRNVVRNVSFTLRPGRVVALVGESGSGKSVIARSLVGLTGANASVRAERLAYGDRDLLDLSAREWQRLRGRDIGFVLQDALVSLDPLRRIGKEVGEALDVHGWGTRKSRFERVIETLRHAGVPEAASRAGQRSGELSGGLRQRALIASAIALEPPFLIADEPTTALDPSVKAQILQLLIKLKTENTGLLLISHDLGFVSHIADEILVLRHGEVVEQGLASQILHVPNHPYTRMLLDAVPNRASVDNRPAQLASRTAPVLMEAHNISKSFGGNGHQSRKVLHDVSLTIREGEALGLIGESGSGKSTLARIAMGFTEPDSGTVHFAERPWNGSGKDAIREAKRRAIRSDIGMIYQDPLGSFDPRWTVRKILQDAIDTRPAERRADGGTASQLLEKVRLPSGALDARPSTLSGGQRQRVAIARAIATHPRLLICDEPVSALDVSVQAQILHLLKSLQQELNLSLLFISHDMAVVRQVCDRVIVMQSGAIIEAGDVRDIFAAPRMDFTKSLLDASTMMEVPSVGARV